MLGHHWCDVNIMYKTHTQKIPMKTNYTKTSEDLMQLAKKTQMRSKSKISSVYDHHG